MLPQPKLEKISKYKWILKEDYSILTNIGYLTVKAGFITDLASIPNWAELLLGVKRDSPKVIVPALIHDILFVTHACSYLKANDIFFDLLKQNKMAIPRRFIMYKVLDLVSWIVYYNYSTQDILYSKLFLTIVK